MSKHIQWLYGEIENWVREGIIGSEQGRAIRGRYPMAESAVSWGKIIFSTIGAILFGLGVILLFAYNWEKMHKFVRLGVIFSFLVIAHGAGLWLRREESPHKAAGEGLNVLGTILFGAGIWLIAQIYHIDEHFPNAFLAWGLGALAMAWALSSVPQGIIASILLTAWNGCEVMAFHNPNHMAAPLIIGTLLPLAWRLRSRALLGVVIPCAGAALWMIAGEVENDLLPPVIFFYSCGLIAWGVFLPENRRFPQAAPICSFFGWIPFVIILYVLSFKGAARDLLRIDFKDTPVLVYFSVMAAFAFISWVPAMLSILAASDGTAKFRKMNLAVLVTLALFTLQSIAGVQLRGWMTAGFFNLVVLFLAISIILHGCKTVNFKWTTLGCLLFSALAMARYADLFESLIVRAFVFFVIGGGIFVVGNFYSRIKKERREGGVS